MKSQVEVAQRPLFYYGFTICRFESELYTSAVVIRYIHAIAEVCSNPVIICPISDRDTRPPEWEPLYIPDNVDVIEIDAYESMVEGVRTKRGLSAKLLSDLQDIDAVLARYPDHYWRDLLNFSRQHSVPFKLHFVGDPISLNHALEVRSNGRQAIAASAKRAVWSLDRVRLRRSLDRDSMVAANGADVVRTYFPERIETAQVLVSSSIEYSEVDPHEILGGPQIRAAFVGIDRPEKRLDIALSAASRLGARLNLQVVGPQGFEDAPNNVQFHGPLNREQIFAVLDDSDVLLVPSESEGTPRVILEAMARGVLVVASDAGGIPDSIDYGRRGVLFRFSSTDSLFEAVDWVDHHRTDARALASAGVEFARDNSVLSFIRELLTFG